VHLERDYDATAEELWLCWTDPRRLARWLGRPDGPLLGATEPVLLVLGDEADQWVRVRVLAAEPPRTLTVAWDFPDETASRLRIDLMDIGPGRTRLILSHSSLGVSSTGYGAGWQAYLEGELLRETGVAVDTTWEQRFEQALPVWRERAAVLR
jgi:uncharacterized protein YndB with AHSA1/START domain